MTDFGTLAGYALLIFAAFAGIALLLWVVDHD